MALTSLDLELPTVSGRRLDVGDPITLTAVRRTLNPLSFVPRAGDIVFGNRLSWVQVAKNVAADQWTHVALVVEIDDELCVVEVGPKGCVTRALDAFQGAYRVTAFARLQASEPCRAAVASWAGNRVGTDVTYSWTHFAVAGGASLARRFSPAAAESFVVRASRGTAAKVDSIKPEAMLCSSFIWDCLAHACDACRPALSWPTRRRVPPWRARPTATDVRNTVVVGLTHGDDRAVRLLVSPSDIWVAPGYAYRIVVEDDHATALHDGDQTTAHVPRPCTRLGAARQRLRALPPPTHEREMTHALSA